MCNLRKHYRPYTEEEIRKLCEEYQIKGAIQLAKELERTYSAVQSKAQSLGIARKNFAVKFNPSTNKKPWNYGLTKEIDSRVAAGAKKLSVTNKGQVAWNKDLTKETDVRVAKNAEGRSENQKQLWQDPQYISMQMKARGVSPNKSEEFLSRFFQSLIPNEFRFVGDGQDIRCIIGGKVPDFIHANQKKIIEFFGDYWHGEERTRIPNEQHEKKRIDLFAQFGYQTLIIWEHELGNLNLLKKKLLNFNRSENNDTFSRLDRTPSL